MKLVFFALLMIWPLLGQALPLQMLWIPEAFVMRQGNCRMDMQNQFAWEKRDSGAFYDYGIGGSCGLYTDQFWGVDVGMEAGLDWRESHERRLTSTMDVFLAHLQLHIFDIRRVGWGVGLGIHSVGFAANVNDYNVSYFLLQHQADSWRMGIGGFAGNAALLIDENGASDHMGAVVGVWRQTSKALFSVEWQSGKSRLGYLFFGGGVILPNNTRISLGYGISNNRVTQRDWVLMKISLDFSWLSDLQTELPVDF